MENLQLQYVLYNRKLQSTYKMKSFLELAETLPWEILALLLHESLSITNNIKFFNFLLKCLVWTHRWVYFHPALILVNSTIR